MAQSPAFKFYAKDFYVGTSVMTAAEVGSYVRMLYCFKVNGPIKNTSKALMQAMGLLSTVALAHVWPEVQKFCALSPRGWKVRNLGEGDTFHARRRRRLQEARETATHTKQQWLEILAAHAGCVRCGVVGQPLEKDHIVPLFMGGSDGPENIQPLCRRCNRSKGTDTRDYRTHGAEQK